jgi:hypothetical protein
MSKKKAAKKEHKFHINLPESQPVAGSPYSVKEVEELAACAACHTSSKRIVLEYAPTEWERMVRYAHECIHAGEEEYGIGPLTDNDVDRLAHLFTEMLFAIVEAQ